MNSVAAMSVIYNDCCGMCRTLATQIADFSDRTIELVPLKSRKGESILKQFYPEKTPHSYFVVEVRDGRTKVSKGTIAALRLAKRLSFSQSLRLLYTYLHYRAHSNLTTEKILSTDHPKDVELTAGSGRREFMRMVVAGSAAMALAAIGIGGSNPVQARLANAISQSTAKGQLPLPERVTISLPQCIDYGCSCVGANYTCLQCIGGVIFCCCQYVPSCNFDCKRSYRPCGYPCDCPSCIGP